MSEVKSNYESWLFRTMNDPALAWARPQSVRRKLALAMFVLPFAFLAAMVAWPSIWWLVALLVVFVPLMGSLNGGIRGLTELRQHQLDEREGRTRDAAYRKVFWPMIATAVAGTVLMMSDGLRPELRAGVGMAAFILVLTMPTLYLAWTLPDDVHEEE
jgi:diacylglycerol kinase